MPSPTPTQRAILEAMRDGGRLTEHVFEQGAHCALVGDRTVPLGTLAALKRREWISVQKRRRHLTGYGSVTDFRLTDAGRAAVEEKP